LHSQRWFWPAALGILLTLASVQILSMRLECQTWDEGFEIASGYSFVKTGEYRISPEQPPLARVLAAVPLLFLNPDVPVQDPSWANRDDRWFGHAFVYRNRVAPDTIVFWARTATVFTSVLLGFVLTIWTRRIFGSAAALGALLLFGFDPNIIAVGRYVKNDLLVALMVLVTVACWREFLGRAESPPQAGGLPHFSGSATWLVATGVAFGLAVATKFSALFLLPVFLLTWFLFRGRSVRVIPALAVITAISIPTVLVVYAPEWRKLVPATRAYREQHPSARRLADGIHVSTARATLFTGAASRLGLQDHPLLVGLARFLDHTSGGHQAYLLGHTSTTGWWYYFPVAFVVKTPVATLAAIGLAVGLAIRRGLRGLGPEWLLCAIPIAIYFPISMVNRVNTGERHLFPIYPFLFILTAAAISRVRFRGRAAVVAILAGLLLVESLSIYPNYLAFFNFAVGGPSAGPRYLVDSNIDWGQDLLKLRDYWIARERPRLCTLYFGTADQDYYGIQHEWVPRTWQTQERQSEHCLAAVSVTPLQDIYEAPGALQWLRERQPVARIGYSIYVYDLGHP
jgi:hypothetical protein